MKNHYIYSTWLMVCILFAGCTDDNDILTPHEEADPLEIKGIRATIHGGEGTRAGTVTKLEDYVGRGKFKSGDKIVFTKIERTTNVLTTFSYSNISFSANTSLAWARPEGEAPDRIYWTDAVSPHTFIAYSIPQGYDTKWKPFVIEEGETRYFGAIGDPSKLDESVIDLSDSTKLADEDVVIAYNEAMTADPGGSVATVKFYHALSSVRVVVNISGFSPSSSAADNKAVVSNMILHHQPTMYKWVQTSAGAQEVVEEDTTYIKTISTAWGNTANKPAYNQRKNMKLWIPNPQGVGTAQSRTFTFYGITTPQSLTHIQNLSVDSLKKTKVSFIVNYPDPLNPSDPSKNKDHLYTASLDTVVFRAGYNTTINISLNHKNEKITVGATYEDWEFIATPDQGNLHKHDTFLQETDTTTMGVITSGNPKADIDDATWLYDTGELDAAGNKIIKDIYGHDGSTTNQAYQISTANQLLSFAYEVKNGMDFTGKYVSLDADLTLQAESDLTKEEIVYGEETKDAYGKASKAIDWIGIGDDTHAFNGTFLGGNRYISRLKGSPLFVSLGANAKIERLNVSAIVIGQHKDDDDLATAAVTGGGLFADTNEGLICACRVDGDVSLSGTTAGAFVGRNDATGKIFASYHIGYTKGTTNVGGLVGTNSGTIASCYHAGSVTGSTTGGIAASGGGTYDNCYYNSTLLPSPSTPATGVTGKTSAEMTKSAFVTTLNAGITLWINGVGTAEHPAHSGYDDHSFVYQAASYPKLSE